MIGRTSPGRRCAVTVDVRFEAVDRRRRRKQKGDKMKTNYCGTAIRYGSKPVVTPGREIDTAALNSVLCELLEAASRATHKSMQMEEKIKKIEAGIRRVNDRMDAMDRKLD